MDIQWYVQLGPALIVAAGAVVCAGLASAAPLRRRDYPTATRRAAHILLLGSLLVIGLLTLSGPWSRPDLYSARTPNLVPLVGLRQQWRNADSELGIASLLGNALLLLPSGALARLAWRRPAGVTLAGLGLYLSVCIEALQYVVGRAADIDDVVLNASGGAVGVALATTLLGAAKRRTPRSARTRRNAD